VAGRGEVYAAMGRHEEAQADFGRAKDLNPGLVVEAAGHSPQLADQS
jgi:tetratricopeptide (TPR) repeat protein